MTEFLDTIRKEGTLKKSLIIATALAKDYTELVTPAEALVSNLPNKYPSRRDGQPNTPGCFIRTMGYKVSWYKFRSHHHAHNFVIASQEMENKEDRHRLSSIVAIPIDIGILEAIGFLESIDSPFAHTKEAFDSLHGHIASIPYGI